MPAVPGAFAWLLVKMNKATQDLYVSTPHFSQLTRSDCSNAESRIWSRTTMLERQVTIPS
jgi:hypothetical protein